MQVPPLPGQYSPQQYHQVAYPPDRNEPEAFLDKFYPPGSYIETPDSFNTDSSIEVSNSNESAEKNEVFALARNSEALGENFFKPQIYSERSDSSHTDSYIEESKSKESDEN